MRYEHSFDIIWKRIGRPYLTVIPSVSMWVLPVGVTFDPLQQAFLSNGVVVSPPWASQQNEQYPYIPGKSRSTTVLTPVGVAYTSNPVVHLLWSTATLQNLQGAWGIVLGTVLYHIASVEVQPSENNPDHILVQIGKATV